MNVSDVSSTGGLRLDSATVGGGPLRDAAGDPEAASFRAALLERARERVDDVVDRFVATTLVFPIIQKASDSPFRSEMFDGGFTESSFRGRLNQIYADQIAGSDRLSISRSLGHRFHQWLEHQDNAALERVVGQKGLDTLG